jgi:hypothetical protein
MKNVEKVPQPEFLTVDDLTTTTSAPSSTSSSTTPTTTNPSAHQQQQTTTNTRPTHNTSTKQTHALSLTLSPPPPSAHQSIKCPIHPHIHSYQLPNVAITMPAAEGFDVNRSQVSEDALAEFLASPVDEVSVCPASICAVGWLAGLLMACDTQGARL